MRRSSGVVKCLLALLYILPMAVQTALADDREYRLTIIPADIARSYFPTGENYLIPVDSKTESLVERARYYESGGSLQQALKVYTMASRRAAGTPAAPYIIFKQCSLEADPERAVSCLSGLIEGYPDFPLIDAVRFELAFRFYIGEEHDRALEILREIEENERGGSIVLTPSAIFFSGIIRAEQEYFEEALSDYGRALEAMHLAGGAELEGLYAALYLETAKAHFALGHFERAEHLLVRIYGTAPSSTARSEALWYLALLYVEREDWGGAYSAYSLLVEQFPDSLFAVQAKRELGSMEAFEIRNIEGVYDTSILTGLHSFDTPDRETAGQGAASESGIGFAVQIGSFSQQENAKALVQQLKELGFPAFLVQAQVNGEYYFRVRVGTFDREEDARTALSGLQDKGYSGFILREE